MNRKKVYAFPLSRLKTHTNTRSHMQFGVLKNAIETVKRKEKKERAEILASLDLVQVLSPSLHMHVY